MSGGQFQLYLKGNNSLALLNGLTVMPLAGNSHLADADGDGVYNDVDTCNVLLEDCSNVVGKNNLCKAECGKSTAQRIDLNDESIS